MAPMDQSGLFYPISLEVPDPNLPWSVGRCEILDLYNDVKSETGRLSTPVLHSISDKESCMSRVFEGVCQRSGILPTAAAAAAAAQRVSSPSPSPCAADGLAPVPVLSDPALLRSATRAKPVKCAFSTVTCAQRVDPNALHMACVDLPHSRTNSLHLKPAMTFGGSARRPLLATTEAEGGGGGDDDAICATSTEPCSQLGRSPALEVASGIGAIVLSATHQDEQQMSGLSSGGGSSLSVDQRDLGSPTSITRGAPQHQQQDQDRAVTGGADSPCFPMKDVKESADDLAVTMDLNFRHDELGMIVDGDSWGEKLEDDDSPGGVAGVYFSEQDSNYRVNAAAAAAPVDPTTSYLMMGDSSNTGANAYNNPERSTFGGLADRSNLQDSSKAAGAVGSLKDPQSMANLAHAMMFRNTFAAVDIAAVEGSRPKRRNVKISKDPQSVAARLRRERISDRIRVLQRMVPNGTKMDTASMLDAAVHYVQFLQVQVQRLETLASGGFDPCLGFGEGPLYRNSPHPYSPLSMDCATVSQGLSSATLLRRR